MIPVNAVRQIVTLICLFVFVCLLFCCLLYRFYSSYVQRLCLAPSGIIVKKRRVEWLISCLPAGKKVTGFSRYTSYL